jgi:hypothetical protein
MECSDSHNNSNSHPAASNGQCTQIVVRAALSHVVIFRWLHLTPVL